MEDICVHLKYKHTNGKDVFQAQRNHIFVRPICYTIPGAEFDRKSLRCTETFRYWRLNGGQKQTNTTFEINEDLHHSQLGPKHLYNIYW
jgi:hypothetical protein